MNETLAETSVANRERNERYKELGETIQQFRKHFPTQTELSRHLRETSELLSPPDKTGLALQSANLINAVYNMGESSALELLHKIGITMAICKLDLSGINWSEIRKNRELRRPSRRINP